MEVLVRIFNRLSLSAAGSIFLHVMVTAPLCAGVLFYGFASAQEPPSIKIGTLFQLTGSAADTGRYGSQGMRMAEKEINERGGILGRKLEIFVTNGDNATTALQEIRRYILKNEVDFLVGIDLSTVALTVSAEAMKHRKIVLFTHAGTSRLTGMSCHRYAFRLVANAVMDARAGALVMKDKPVNRWYGIGSNSDYGRNSWEAFQLAIRKVRPEVQFVGESWPDPFTSDYAPVISKAIQAKPDAVWSTLWGGDLVAFIRAANALDFFAQVKFFINPRGASLGVLVPLGDEMPGGLWVSTPYWFLYPASANNRVFVEAYKGLYGEYPADVALLSYSAIYLLKQAIEKVGSLDTEKIIAQLEGISYRDPEGLKTIRKQDHQVVTDVVWGRTTNSDKYHFRILDDLVAVPGEKIMRSIKETRCQM